MMTLKAGIVKATMLTHINELTMWENIFTVYCFLKVALAMQHISVCELLYCDADSFSCVTPALLNQIKFNISMFFLSLSGPFPSVNIV